MNAHQVTLEMLADWLDGQLTPEMGQMVEGHLTGCARCAADLAWMRRFQAAARAEPLPDPPAELVQQAKALFARRHSRTATAGMPAAFWFRLWKPAAVAALVLLIAVLALFAASGRQGSAVLEPAISDGAIPLIEVKRAGDSGWTPLPAQSLPAGSVLRVAQGSAQLSLFDGSTVRIHAGTELKLASLHRGSLLPDSRRVVVEQNAGTAEYHIAPAAGPWAEFQVRLPVGAVIVRGTRFQVEVQTEHRARVTVLEGLVEVMGDVDRTAVSAGGQAVLERGAPVAVTPGKGAVTPAPLPEHRSVTPTASPASGTARPAWKTPGFERTPEPRPTRTWEGTPARTRSLPTWTAPSATPTEPPTAAGHPTRRPRWTETPMPTRPISGSPTPPPAPSITPWPTHYPVPTWGPTLTPDMTPTRRGPGPQPSPWPTPIHTPRPWPTPEPTGQGGRSPWPTPSDTPRPWTTPEPTPEGGSSPWPMPPHR